MKNVLVGGGVLRTVRYRRCGAGCRRRSGGQSQGGGLRRLPRRQRRRQKTLSRALAGKSENEIAQALQDYKSGKRANPIMKSFATPLSDQDMANLAAYYASLK